MPHTEQLTGPERPAEDLGRPLIDVRPVSWEDVEAAPDQRTVTIRYFGGTPFCYGVDHVRAQFREEVIVLTVFVGTGRDLDANAPPGVSVACTDELLTKWVTVDLGELVDERTIVDGASQLED